MTTLNIDSKQFADIVLIFLMDHIVNSEQVTNENLVDFINKHGSVIKPALMKQYLNMDSSSRLNYRRISGVFNNSDNSIQQIRISPSVEEKEKDEKEGNIKKAVKTALKKTIKKIIDKKKLTKEDIEILRESINIDL